MNDPRGPHREPRREDAEFDALFSRESALPDDLATLRSAVSRLAGPLDTPDLSGQILSRVEARRPFLPRRARRRVTAGRVAILTGLVVTAGLISFTQRYAPRARLADSAAPVGRVVEITSRTALGQPDIIENTVETIQASLVSPVARLSLNPRIRPEASVKYSLEIPAPAPHREAVPAFALGAPAPGTVVAAPPTAAASPFIDRFGSLLVILREPEPAIDDDE